MDLLAELRGLFNAPTLTDSQALDRVRAATNTSAELTTARTDLTQRDQTIAQLRQQITDLQGRVPKALDEEVRAERMIRVTERAESLVAQGVFSPADSKGLLTDLVGIKFDADGKVDTAASKIDDVMLARAPGASDCRAAVLFARLRTCKPVPPRGHDDVFAQKRQEQQQGGNDIDRQAELLKQQLSSGTAAK